MPQLCASQVRTLIFFPVGLEIQRKIRCWFKDKALVLQRAELLRVAHTCAALVLQ